MTPESTALVRLALVGNGFTVTHEPTDGTDHDWKIEWNTICTKGESPVVKPCHEWFTNAELEQLARSIGWKGEGE